MEFVIFGLHGRLFRSVIQVDCFRLEMRWRELCNMILYYIEFVSLRLYGVRGNFDISDRAELACIIWSRDIWMDTDFVIFQMS